MTKSETNDTLAFYRDNAATYAARERKPPTARLEAFMRRLSPGAAVLDLGCGGGHDSLILLEHGFDVTACDGSADLAREAELRIGRKVEVTRFQEIVWEERFDGIWAEASLLHVPRAELADVLTRIRRTLKPGGLLQASFKAGETEGHDRFGRYFNYPRPNGSTAASRTPDGRTSRSARPMAVATTASRPAGCMWRQSVRPDARS